MSAVILNPVVRRSSTVRIICNRCTGPKPDHDHCMGKHREPGVVFICACPVCRDKQPTLFGGNQ